MARAPATAPPLAALLTTLALGAPSVAARPSFPPALPREAGPRPSPAVLALARESVRCAQRSGIGVTASRLAVIDYSVPSLEPRLWVLDLGTGAVLFYDHVAHGRGTGENYAEHFSNRPGSHQTSLGLFLTQDTYLGHNGYSLRMIGLEPGVNDLAWSREIVLHGADYVDPAAALRRGRLGQSWGCPAVRRAVARPIIDALAGGQFVFAYYPAPAWLASSRFLDCRDRLARGAP